MIKIIDTNLPTYIQNRSKPVQDKWTSIYTNVKKESNETEALLVANTWLQNSVKEQALVARTDKHIERVTFVVDEKQFIKRTEDGDDYISFKLADVFKDKFGVELPETVLQTWADKINTEPIVGDIDHEEYDKWLSQGLSDDEIKDRLRNKSGIAKTVKAVVDKGRLWVKAVVDKKYRHLLGKLKGVSLEALVMREDDGSVSDGELLGFTFGVRHTPQIDGSEIQYA